MVQRYFSSSGKPLNNFIPQGITANNSKNYKPSLRVPKLNSTELRVSTNISALSAYAWRKYLSEYEELPLLLDGKVHHDDQQVVEPDQGDSQGKDRQ